MNSPKTLIRFDRAFVLGAIFLTLGCSAESTKAPAFSADGADDEILSESEDIAAQPSLGEPAPVEKSDMSEPVSENGVANLPYSRGKVFASLDEYLAHLEKNGEIDLPYWRQIKPGVYEFVVRMPGAEREIATREELMERYGFTR